MARVTVEDCLKNVKNRFELVLIASKRARQLMRGKEPKVEWDNDKATVVALREIAAGHTDIDTHDTHEEEINIQVTTTAASLAIDMDAEDENEGNESLEASPSEEETTPHHDEEEHDKE